MEVKFKAISGREDQAGGVIWRAKDTNNYYIARANALEDNVAIYHTVNRRRTEKRRTNMKVAANQWHTLRVDFQGNPFNEPDSKKAAVGAGALAIGAGGNKLLREFEDSPGGGVHRRLRFDERHHTEASLGAGETMDTNTLLIILVVVLLLGGGGFFYRRR